MTTSAIRVRPRPYRPGELRALRDALDERWPSLREDEALHWLRRYRDGRSPYSRVRRHVIRAQLDAVVALAIELGLRRAEIFDLTVAAAHDDNAYVVVGDWRAETHRCVPFTCNARAALSRWTECHFWLCSDSEALLLNMHTARAAGAPMRRDTFHRLLNTYVGPGWELRRLRDTCAVAWVRAGMPLEHLRELLGLARIEDTLPYARLIGGSLEGRMAELDRHVAGLIGPSVTP